MTVNPLDPMDQDWADLSSKDDWMVPCVYVQPARELVARELERIADKYAARAKDERLRSQLLRDGSPGWQFESSIASYQELHGFAREMKRRAAELRAAAGTREESA